VFHKAAAYANKRSQKRREYVDTGVGFLWADWGSGIPELGHPQSRANRIKRASAAVSIIIISIIARASSSSGCCNGHVRCFDVSFGLVGN